jgi:hypothetical protein
MNQSNTNNSRRSFLKKLVLISAAVPASKFLSNGNVSMMSAWAGLPAVPAGQKSIPETDAVAQALGYKHDIKDIDYKRYPQRKRPEQKANFCNNCALYTAVDGNWGKCQMLQAGLVHAKGWCGSWSKKS